MGINILKSNSEINSKKLVQNRELSDYMNNLLEEKLDFQTGANLLLGDISEYLNKEEKSINETTLTKERFIDLVNNVSNKTLSSKNLKDILSKIMEESSSIEEIIKSSNISNITDTTKIEEVVDSIISANPESVSDYKNGHDRAIKFLMGQVMKETKGGVNPSIAMSILKDKLDK